MADDNAKETTAPIATEQPSEATRPEYVQEKFWNADTKQVNVENLASSYNTLEQKLGSRTEDLSKQIRDDIEKEMGANPRRISAIRIHIHFPKNYSDKEKKLLEKTAYTCPVGKSLNDQLEEEISFHYPN